MDSPSDPLPRDKLNFENRSTLAVYLAMKELYSSYKILKIDVFSTVPNCHILKDSKDFWHAASLSKERPSRCISLIPPILVN